MGKSRTTLCRLGSDSQVRGLESFASKTKGFKQDIDMVKLVFQD